MSFVNLFLYVIKLYNRAIKNMTSDVYVLKYVIMYEKLRRANY